MRMTFLMLYFLHFFGFPVTTKHVNKDYTYIDVTS